MDVKEITLEKLLYGAREMGCTDVHLTVGASTVLRLNGNLVDSGLLLKSEDVEKLILSLIDEKQKIELDRNIDLDFTFSSSDGYRHRVNIFKHRGKLAAIIRLLKSGLMELKEINIPEVLFDFSLISPGFYLISGPSGSGKTTTMASIIDKYNKSIISHILSIENPLEYLYENGKSIVHQREVGKDVNSAYDAITSSSHEDVDILAIGEFTDFDSLDAAVSAAESGRMVIGTINSNNVAQTIDRVIDLCPLERQAQFRIKFANALKAIISQKLIPSSDLSSILLINEILVGTDSTLNVVRQGKTNQLITAIQSGASLGMHTFNSDLARLYNAGKITKEIAIKYTPDKNDLMQYIRN